MNTKHTPARTVDEIMQNMREEMPFAIPDHILPYIKEAIRIYAKEQNAELLEALIQIKSLCGKTYPTNEAIFEIPNNAIKKATE